MNKQDVAKVIDHTNLKADARLEDIKKTCQEAKEYGFRSVCVNSRWVKLAKEELSGTNIKVVSVIDWPVGASTTEARVFQAKHVKKDGGDEIDPVLDIGGFKMGDYEAVLKDLKSLAEVLPTKLIIETGYLTDEEIKKAAQLVKEAGCYCVKTSTGMEPKVDIDKKVLQIKMIRQVVGPDYPIKAAGGVRNIQDAEKVIAAGANIIGTSNGVEIMKGEESRSGY